MTSRSRVVSWLLGSLLFLSGSPHPALAAVPFGGGGFDAYSGPGGQTTRGATAIAGASLGGALGVFSVTRFDDSVVGMGTGYSAMLGVPLGSATSMRAWGSRSIGDGTFSAWRFKAGPRLALAHGASLGLYYLHYGDHAGTRSDGGSAEAEVPVGAMFSARASAGVAAIAGSETSDQGMVGIGWRPWHGVELTGEVGLARNGSLAFSPGPAPLPVLPLLGVGSDGGSSGGTTTRSSKVEALSQFGLRIMLP